MDRLREQRNQAETHVDEEITESPEPVVEDPVVETDDEQEEETEPVCNFPAYLARILC